MPGQEKGTRMGPTPASFPSPRGAQDTLRFPSLLWPLLSPLPGTLPYHLIN